MDLARLAAGLAALTSGAALALQFGLLVSDMTAAGQDVGAAVWRFLGFFTLLTNMAVAVVAGAMALAPGSRLASARPRFAVAVAILLVGLVYSVALRALWDPKGWNAVADHALHDAAPLLFFAAWLLAPHGTLRWDDVFWSLVMPFAYVAYALARGALDGWYAYWFLDPGRLGPPQMAANLSLLTLAFLAVAALLVALDLRLARTRGGRAPGPDVGHS